MKTKSDLPLLSNGDIDYSKIDIINDFHLLPQIFKTPDDIEKYIIDRNLSCPVLKNLLILRRENKLDLTPTETEVYFDSFFDYIYDVFRVPVEETWKRMDKWLYEYLENEVVFGGLTAVRDNYFDNRKSNFKLLKDFVKITTEEWCPIINYVESIGDLDWTVNNGLDSSPDLLEHFYIKSGQQGGQPFIDEETGEAYMGVRVKKDNVYIYGCDDMSYTYFADTEKESLEFADFLKRFCHVYNFGNYKEIHTKLEFTN